MATTVDCVQLICEETPRYEGAPTAAAYRLSTNVHYPPIQNATLAPAVSHIDRGDEQRGIEGAPPMLVETYEPAGSLGIRAYANTLPWLLHAAGMSGAVTAGNGVITDPDSAVIPTGAYRWVFTKRGGLQAKSLQIMLAYASRSVFWKGQGYGVSSFAFDGEGAITADLTGLVLVNSADPNITPSYDSSAIPPFRRGDMTLTWLGSGGTVENFSFTIANPLNRRRTYTLATPSYFADVLEHADDKVRLTGSIPKSALADADLDALMAATSFAGTAKWASPVNIGATSYKYKMWLQMPNCQHIGGGPQAMANVRRFGMDVDFWSAWDEASGYDFKITVVNGVSAIETYV